MELFWLSSLSGITEIWNVWEIEGTLHKLVWHGTSANLKAVPGISGQWGSRNLRGLVLSETGHALPCYLALYFPFDPPEM